MPAEKMAQFNWKQQVPIMKGDSLIGMKVLPLQQPANQLTYLIVHTNNGGFTHVVLHTIQYSILNGIREPQGITSNNYTQKIQAYLAVVNPTINSSPAKHLTKVSQLSHPAPPSGAIVASGSYENGEVVPMVPTTYVLVNGAFMPGSYDGGYNPFDPYQNLDYLDPLQTPDAGSPIETYPYSTHRILNGVWYTIDDYPYKDKGFPWFWMEDPEMKNANGYLYVRLAELYAVLAQSPNALIDCNELQALISYGPMFQQISTFQIPATVINRLNEVRQQAPNFVVDNFNVQLLQNASGTLVNCDFFPVKITQLPNGYSAESLLEYFRTHINNFISPSQNISFHPYQEGSFNDAVKFNSHFEESIGALIHIEMLNDGTVIQSDYQRNTYSSGNQWNRFTFSTLETPLDFEHPVAGNRQFGIYSNISNPNEFTFYTMGVDRIWDPITELGDFLTPVDGFKDADELWSNIQSNFIQFVISNGGMAAKFNPQNYISRPKWPEVASFMKGDIDLTTLKNRLGC